jgi:hypothetical protein
MANKKIKKIHQTPGGNPSFKKKFMLKNIRYMPVPHPKPKTEKKGERIKIERRGFI